MWFKVNFDKLFIELTPTFLRKQGIVAFVSTAFSPLRSIYDDWFRIRNENLYKLAHNGQVCFLRKALNDRFDYMARRIFIANGNRYLRKYIYTHPEERPDFLGKMHLYSKDDYADTGVDFIVFVPKNIIAAQIYEIEALIDFYKEGVKRYKIVKI